MLIGELVKNYIPQIINYCQTIDSEELKRLTDKNYSKEIFNLNFPFCTEIDKAALTSKRYWKPVYSVNGVNVRFCSQWIIENKYYFLDYLLDKNIINKVKYVELDSKVKLKEGVKRVLKHHTESNFKTLKHNSNISSDLMSEAQEMSRHYEKFYRLERSIRQMVRETLKDVYGEKWWNRLEEGIKDNVARNMKYELDTSHTKRSEHWIDYSTFGDLRKIINSEWHHFEKKFQRKLTSVNEVLIDLNRIRVSIAHCTPLADREIKRLDLRIDDWFFTLNKN